jgi:hypothetical protein
LEVAFFLPRKVDDARICRFRIIPLGLEPIPISSFTLKTSVVIIPAAKFLILRSPFKAHDDLRAHGIYNVANPTELFRTDFVTDENLSMAHSEAIFYVLGCEKGRARHHNGTNSYGTLSHRKRKFRHA